MTDLSDKKKEILLTSLDDGADIFISREEAKNSQTLSDAITDEGIGQIEIPVPFPHATVELITTYLHSPDQFDISKFKDEKELILFQKVAIWFGIDRLLEKIIQQIAKLYEPKSNVDILNSTGEDKSFMIEKNLSLQRDDQRLSVLNSVRDTDNQRLSVLKLFSPKDYNYVLYTNGEFILTDGYFESDELLIEMASMFSYVIHGYNMNITSIALNGYTIKYGTIIISPYTYIYGRIDKNNSSKMPFEDMVSSRIIPDLNDIFPEGGSLQSLTINEHLSSSLGSVLLEEKKNSTETVKTVPDEKKSPFVVEAYRRKEYHLDILPKKFTNSSNRQKYIIGRLLADKNFIPDTISQIVSHIPGSEYKCVPIHVTNKLLQTKRHSFIDSFRLRGLDRFQVDGQYVLVSLDNDEENNTALILDTKMPFNKYYIPHYGWKDDIDFIDKQKLVFLGGEHSSIALFDLKNGQNEQELKPIYNYEEEVYAVILPRNNQKDGYFCLWEDRKLYSIEGKFIKSIVFPKVDELSDRSTSSGNYIIQQGWINPEDSDDPTITSMCCYHPRTDRMITIVSDPGDEIEFNDDDRGDYLCIVHYKIKTSDIKVYILYEGKIIKEIEEKTSVSNIDNIKIKNNNVIINDDIVIETGIIMPEINPRKLDDVAIHPDESIIIETIEKSLSEFRKESITLLSEPKNIDPFGMSRDKQLGNNWGITIKWLLNGDALIFVYRNPLDIYTLKYCLSKNQLSYIPCVITDFIEVTDTNCLVVRNGYSGTVEIWI